MLQIYCFGVTYVFLKCWKESRKIVGCLYFFVGRWDMILTFYCKQFGIFYIWYFLVLHGHARRVTKVFLLHVSSFYGSQQKFAKQCRNFENSTYKKCYIRDFFFSALSGFFATFAYYWRNVANRCYILWKNCYTRNTFATSIKRARLTHLSASNTFGGSWFLAFTVFFIKNQYRGTMIYFSLFSIGHDKFPFLAMIVFPEHRNGSLILCWTKLSSFGLLVQWA
jgi:hypothetical protein